MNILEISTLFPRWPGDSRGPIILKIAQALNRLGHRVGVINMHGPNSKSYECWDGIEIFRPRYFWPDRFESLQDTGGGLPAAWEKRPFTRLLFPLLLLAQAKAIIAHAKDYDVLHAHFTIPAMAAVLTKPIHRKPIVVTVRGSDVYRIPKYPLGKTFNHIALSKCDKITAMSHDLLNEVRAAGIPSGKLEYIPPPIDLEKFPPGIWDKREPIILYVASLIERKGPRILIEAFHRIAEEFPSFRLVMVGKGPEAPQLNQLAVDLNLKNRIEFIEYLTQDQVADLMRRATLFVLPSLEEALGMVIVEALASGLPVIGTNAGGIPEVVTPDVGMLVPPGDAPALAEAMRTLLSNPGTLAQMSERAPKHVRLHFYTHDQNAAHLVSLFSSLIDSEQLSEDRAV